MKLSSEIEKIKKNNMRYYILNGVLLSIVTSLYQSFAQKFIYRLHGNNNHVFLFNQLPGIIAIITLIPGMILVNRACNKKKIIAGSFLISRFFILLLAVVPFLPQNIQPLAFVYLYGIMNFPSVVSNTALQSFTSDIFEGDECAVAISDRNKYSSFVNLFALIILGQAMKKFGTTDKSVIPIYQIFFILAFILGLFEVWTFCKLKQVKVNENSNKKSKDDRKATDIISTFLGVFKNKRFDRYLICSLIYYFGWQMGWPLFNIYQIDYLKADEFWLMILGVTSGFVMFVCYNFWKRMIIKKGNSYTIAYATLGMSITPILYAISPNLYILTVVGLITGFFTSGTTTVILSALLENVPEKNKEIYVTVHVFLTNITLIGSAFLGKIIMQYFDIYAALYVSAAIRFLGSMAFFIRNRIISKNEI